MTRKEAVAFVYKKLLETKNLKETCKALVRNALEQGSGDNITCQLILLHELKTA